MRLDAAFLPQLLTRPERSVCIVIDVLRATSTLVTLASRGVAEVVVVPEIEQAFDLRRAAADQPPLLCGEVGGLPPEGFDYGNSPVEFAELDLRARRAILFTSNGTKALVQTAAAAAIFAGALLNRSTVAEAALRAAIAGGHDLMLVCSGTDLGTSYCLEDAFCAGALAEAIVALAPGVQLGDGAETTLRLCRSFGGDARIAFETAEHGRTLARIGLAADLDFCAQTDRYAIAPRVRRRDALVVVSAE
jgi:2-phosphosulfolactate phosphatase